VYALKEKAMLVTKVIKRVCNSIHDAKLIDSTSLQVGTKTIRIRDNNGLYDVVSVSRNFAEKPQIKRNVFATDLDEVIRNLFKGE
jgi:predicted glycosyltransferase